MSTPPLSYDSLKHFLQHLEASKRIHLAKRCPSIRAVEKRVPLQIDNLQLLRVCGVKINGQLFRIKFYPDDYDAPFIPIRCEDGSMYNGPYPPRLILLIKSEVVGEQQIETVESYERTKSYDAAVVFLLHKIFGERTGPIYVKTFANSFYWRDFDPFPFAVEFRIRHLNIYTMPDSVWKNLEALRRIIDEASFPLKSLKCYPFKLADTIRLFEDVVEDVKVPKILCRLCTPEVFTLLKSISNSVVHFFETPLNDDVLIALIEHWRTTNRPIGNEYTFTDERTSMPEIHNKMEDIREHFNGKTLGEGTIIIPMNAIAQIKVSYGVHPHFAPDENWALKVTVEAVES